jgi:FtsZ-interacting cell division protein YlmF
MFGALREIWDKIVGFFSNLFLEPEVVVEDPDKNPGDNSKTLDTQPEVVVGGRISGDSIKEEMPSQNDVVVFIPRAYEDVKELKKYMDAVSVIVLDLTELPDEYERTMFLDFVWGMVRAAGGHFKILDPIGKSYTLITSCHECNIRVLYGSSVPYEEEAEQTEEVAQ